MRRKLSSLNSFEKKGLCSLFWDGVEELSLTREEKKQEIVVLVFLVPSKPKA